MSRRFGLSELVLLNVDLLMWGWIIARNFH